MPIEPLTDDQLHAIATAHVGDYLGYGWTQDYVEGDSEEPAYYLVKTKNGMVVATMPDWAAGVALFLPEAHDAVPALVAEVVRARRILANLEAKLAEFPLAADESKLGDYELGRRDLADTIRTFVLPRPAPSPATVN
jgi:hypothetical protein